jgi:AcrR family transcriptional regulator
MPPATQSPSPVQQRILAAAFDLFYRQGYRATGINQVIAQSGVAKASFYDHFPSKDDLLLAYARETAAREVVEMRQYVETFTTPRERFFAPLRMLCPWFESSDYRGCPFQNLMAEAPPDHWRVRDVARQHQENLRRILHGLSRDLIRSEPALAHLDATELADTYLLLLNGAIAAAVAYRQPWPVDKAMATLEARLQEAG